MLGLTAPDQRTVLDVFVYCVLWFTLYFVCLRSICRKRSAIYTNRVVSLVHAVVALFLAPTALNWRHPFSQFGQTTTEQQVKHQAYGLPQNLPVLSCMQMTWYVNYSGGC